MMASVMTRSEMKKLDGITEEINNVLKKHSAKLFAGVLDCGHGDMEFRLRLVIPPLISFLELASLILSFWFWNEMNL